ncbi:hypothetical protein SAMN05216268_1114 [Streptomyces yunnanensis]|uniref:Uncharacterized protein n=1 Tax=Streptomyces yunnanensis TaxID=156453 RepID=A0A9X8QVG7_9ACTN|nr:hypothetical protein SAMN05216268_1114 [Streptomyces yunnanensis]
MALPYRVADFRRLATAATRPGQLLCSYPWAVASARTEPAGAMPSTGRPPELAARPLDDDATGMVIA